MLTPQGALGQAKERICLEMDIPRKFPGAGTCLRLPRALCTGCWSWAHTGAVMGLLQAGSARGQRSWELMGFISLVRSR